MQDSSPNSTEFFWFCWNQGWDYLDKHRNRHLRNRSVWFAWYFMIITHIVRSFTMENIQTHQMSILLLLSFVHNAGIHTLYFPKRKKGKQIFGQLCGAVNVNGCQIKWLAKWERNQTMKLHLKLNPALYVLMFKLSNAVKLFYK